MPQAIVASRPARRLGRGEAGVEENEGAGSVCVLAHALLDARLAEQGGLLVAGHARHRDRVTVERLRARLAQDARALKDARQRSLGNIEQVHQLGVPTAGHDVEEHGARGVGDVCDVLAGELEAEPGVDRAERGPPRERTLAQALDVLEQPLDLGGGEVGVEHEPGALAHERFMPGGPQLLAARRRAAVLPDDRVVQRQSAGGVPHADRLALVGHPHARELPLLQPGVGQRLPGDRLGDLPDFKRVVLDPARLGEVLSELPVAAADGLGQLVEHQTGGAGRSLIYRKDHVGASLPAGAIGAHGVRELACAVGEPGRGAAGGAV